MTKSSAEKFSLGAFFFELMAERIFYKSLNKFSSNDQMKNLQMAKNFQKIFAYINYFYYLCGGFYKIVFNKFALNNKTPFNNYGQTGTQTGPSGQCTIGGENRGIAPCVG
jgi:hypothetical protein